MDLMTFAKQLREDYSDQEFVDLLKQVIDLDELKNLSDREAQNLHDAAQFLSDYMLLHKEFYGQAQSMNGHPYVVCNSPYIENQLTRPYGKKPDFSYLKTFGVGE